MRTETSKRTSFYMKIFKKTVLGLEKIITLENQGSGTVVTWIVSVIFDFCIVKLLTQFETIMNAKLCFQHKLH